MHFWSKCLLKVKEGTFQHASVKPLGSRTSDYWSSGSQDTCLKQTSWHNIVTGASPPRPCVILFWRNAHGKEKKKELVQQFAALRNLDVCISNSRMAKTVNSSETHISRSDAPISSRNTDKSINRSQDCLSSLSAINTQCSRIILNLKLLFWNCNRTS